MSWRRTRERNELESTLPTLPTEMKRLPYGQNSRVRVVWPLGAPPNPLALMFFTTISCGPRLWRSVPPYGQR